MLVPQHRGEGRRADRAELDGLVRKALRDLPDRRVYERAARQFIGHDTRLARLLHLPEDLAGLEAVALHPAARGVAVSGDPAHALDRTEEPARAAARDVQTAVASR